MGRRYFVPINTAEAGKSQTVDVVELIGTKKQRRKQWRNYLKLRTGERDVHKLNKITRSMGFRELV